MQYGATDTNEKIPEQVDHSFASEEQGEVG